MALTIDEMKTEIRGNLGGRTDYDAQLDIWIELAQQRITRITDPEDLTIRDTSETTVASQASNVSTPATNFTIREISSVIVAESADTGRRNNLTRLKVDEFYKRWPKPVAHAEELPTHYYLQKWDASTDVTFFWFPIPDAIYEIHYIAKLWPRAASTFTGSDNLDIRHSDDAIISLATSIGYLSIGREDKADKFFSVFRSQIGEVALLKYEDLDTTIAGVRVSDPGRNFSGLGYNDPFIRWIMQ